MNKKRPLHFKLKPTTCRGDDLHTHYAVVPQEVKGYMLIRISWSKHTHMCTRTHTWTSLKLSLVKPAESSAAPMLVVTFT